MSMLGDFCPDCVPKGIFSVPIPDSKFQGDVCPSCKRIFKIGGNPKNFEYTEEAACKDKMREDMAQNVIKSVSTKALVDRILKGDV